MVKYAKRINAQKRGVSEDEGNTTTLGDVYTVVKSWVENNPSGSDLYKKLTKMEQIQVEQRHMKNCI